MVRIRVRQRQWCPRHTLRELACLRQALQVACQEGLPEVQSRPHHPLCLTKSVAISAVRNQGYPVIFPSVVHSHLQCEQRLLLANTARNNTLNIFFTEVWPITHVHRARFLTDIAEPFLSVSMSLSLPCSHHSRPLGQVSDRCWLTPSVCAIVIVMRVCLWTRHQPSVKSTSCRDRLYIPRRKKRWDKTRQDEREDEREEDRWS